MRRRYKIEIEARHKAELDHALKMVNRDVDGAIVGFLVADDDGQFHNIYEYQVDLSKYELLFVRLACSSGKFVKMKKT